MMTALAILVALLAVCAAGWLIYKKAHAAASLFVVGFALLVISWLMGMDGNRTVDLGDSATGHGFYDQLLVMESLFKSRLSGIGLSIMVLFGFVAYMRHIGADAKTVVLLSRPLSRFKGSYWLVFAGFLLGNVLSLVIPSAAALSLLLIATLLPALVAAGLTPLTVGAIVVTSSTIVPSPLEAGLIQGAELTGMAISDYVGQVALATVPTILIMAVTHMLWQRWCDRRDESRGAVGVADGEHLNASTAAMHDAIERAAKLPNFYAILPLLPLLVIATTATLRRLEVIDFESGIMPATIVSLMVTLLIEIIRRRSFQETVDSVKQFFVGLGEGVAGVVSLLISAAILVEGITQLGIISMITQGAKDSHGAALLVVLLFVIATGLIATLTGSGTAPYFAFSEMVPALAAESSILPVRMLTSIWGTSNLARQLSPVCAAVLIVAGAIKVNPMQLVKRTSVPMLVGIVCNVLFAFLFIHA